MRFRLWGTRGSIASPLRFEEIEAKIIKALSGASGVDLNDPMAVRAYVASLPPAIRGTAGGDTSCVEVHSAGNVIILDCGTGMRRLGYELIKEEFGQGQGQAHIFISHTHWDHMLGWLYFLPAYRPGNKITFYGIHPDLKERFTYMQRAPDFHPVPLEYMAADIEFLQISEGETVELDGTQVRSIRLNHAGDSFGFRIEDEESALVYATDSEYKSLDIDKTHEYVDFFREADALIFDAMFTLPESYRKEDWGHSSALAGATLSARAGVRHLLLFHHDPSYTDEEIWDLRRQAEEYLESLPSRPNCQVIVAHDGLEMELWREAHLDSRIEQRAEGIILHFAGRITEETRLIVHKTVERARVLDPDNPIVINLDQVVGIDPSGLSSILFARRHTRPLALASLSRELRHTFERAGCLDFFAIFDTPDQALSRLSQGVNLQLGQQIDNRYEIQKQIGKGPLGDVFIATDQLNQRPVAIKVLCPSISPSGLERLRSAARTSTALRHPQIGSVYQVGQDGVINYIAVEYLAGRSVRQLIEGEGQATAQPAQLVVEVGLAVARILEFAHAHSQVHAGLKPENIILNHSAGQNSSDPTCDQIKVTDFGIARLAGDKPLTEVPAYLGRLDYLAPEQIEGRGASPSSDIYALGVTLYEMSTGQLPFAATASDSALIGLQLRQPPVPPRRRNAVMSRSLEHLILKLVRKSPKNRYPSAEAVRHVLTGLCPHRPHKALLGRDPILKTLRAHLRKVASGQSRLVLLEGPVGMGKSHLATSVAEADWGGPPVTTIHAKVFDKQDQRPYRLIISGLRNYLAQQSAHQTNRLLDELGGLASDLVILVPEVDPSIFEPTSPKKEYPKVSQALITLFEKLLSNRPVLLIFDGLQWADDASLRFVKKLARLDLSGLFILGLYRSNLAQPNGPLTQFINDLEEEQRVDECIDLPPLGPIDLHKIALALCGLHKVPSDFSLWLYSETDGNPMHAEQLIQAYMEGPGEARHPRERDIPTTLEDVILRRLERLPDAVLAVLRQAAVIGQSFDLDTLRATMDEPEMAVLSELDTALQAQFVVGDPEKEIYQFSHPFVREVVYAEMLGSLRRRLHRRVARVLEINRSDNSMAEVIDQLAYHFVQGGEHKKALSYLARAIRRSRNLHAFGVAVDYVDQALETLDQLSQTSTTSQELEHRETQRQELLSVRAKLMAAPKQ